MNMFANTKEALLCLQQSLLCQKCQKLCMELTNLGSCEHLFCRPCALTNAGYPCPECGLPSKARDLSDVRHLSHVASLCSQMISILNENESVEYEKHQSTDSVSCPKLETFSTLKENNLNEKETIKDKKKQKETNIQPEQCGSAEKKKMSRKKSDNLTRNELLENNEFVKIKDSDKRTDHDSSMACSDISFTETVRAATPSKRKKKTKMSRNIANITKMKEEDSVHAISPGHSGRNRISSPQLTSMKPGLDSNTKKQSTPGTKQSTPGTKQSTAGAKQSTPGTKQSTAGAKQSTPGTKQSTPSAKGEKKNLNKRNAKGETPLQVATIKMDIEAVRRFLETGANPNVKDNAGWTPLHEAIGRGRADIAALLIESGASVNAPGLDNETPLHDAVMNNYIECVQLLIDKGASVFSRNAHGHTALDIAHNGEVKDLLLSASQAMDVSNEELPLLDESSKPLCFTASNLSKEESKHLTRYAKLLQARMVQDVIPEVTHLITHVDDKGSCSRTMKYLQALLTGKRIVSMKWLETSLNTDIRVPEGEFQVAGCSSHPNIGAPNKALLNRLKQLPPLFDGCQFYFYGKFNLCGLTKEQLASLVKLAGGTVLTREPHLYNLDDYPYTHPYHAQGSSSLSDCTIFKIYDDGCVNPPSVEAQRMSCLPASWLLDSIVTFSFLDKPKSKPD